MNQLADWLERHMMTCYYKQLSGIDCPGCGMQRSFIFMLKGNFGASFHSYPALLPVLFTLTLTAIHLCLKLKNGAALIKYSFIITISIVVISYILKFIR
jgi:hypothetical protein